MSDRSWGVPGGLFLFLSPSIVGYEVATLSIGIRGCTVLILEREKKIQVCPSARGSGACEEVRTCGSCSASEFEGVGKSG